MEQLAEVEKTEGIEERFLCSRDDLERKISRGEITDSFTLCAWQLLGAEEE